MATLQLTQYIQQVMKEIMGSNNIFRKSLYENAIKGTHFSKFWFNIKRQPITKLHFGYIWSIKKLASVPGFELRPDYPHV